jgi:hypothetical protein
VLPEEVETVFNIVLLEVPVTQIFSHLLIVVGVPMEEVLSLLDRFGISSHIVQSKCISQDGAKVLSIAGFTPLKGLSATFGPRGV